MADTKDIDLTLQLLVYALTKAGVESGDYAILRNTQAIPNDEKLYLQENSGDTWSVYFCERGAQTQVAHFERYQDAAKYFYWVLTGTQDFWSYREEWKKKGGDHMDV